MIASPFFDCYPRTDLSNNLFLFSNAPTGVLSTSIGMKVRQSASTLLYSTSSIFISSPCLIFFSLTEFIHAYGTRDHVPRLLDINRQTTGYQASSPKYTYIVHASTRLVPMWWYSMMIEQHRSANHSLSLSLCVFSRLVVEDCGHWTICDAAREKAMIFYAST